MSEETTETTEAAEKGPKEFKSNPRPIHESLARYVNEKTGDQVEDIDAAQAEALLKLHKFWQSSPERKAEREEEQKQAAIEKAEREEKAAIKKAEDKAKKEAEDAKKKAEAAADTGDDSDLDDLDGEADETPAPAKTTSRARRRKPAAAAADDDL